MTQTAEPRDGFVTAIKGQDGRLPAPPKGDLYVRDPIAARAKAIRDRVALFHEQKREIPEHLQQLFDALPPEETDTNEEVELVDEVTGAHVAEVELDEGKPQPSGTGSNTPVYKSQEPKAPAPPPEPEPVAAEPPGSTGTVQDGVIETVNITELDESLGSTFARIKPELKFTQASSGAGALAAQTAAIVRAAGEEIAVPEVDVTVTIEPPAPAEAPEPPKAPQLPKAPPRTPRPGAKRTAPRKKV